MVHRLSFRAMGTEILACVDVDSGQPPALLAEVPRWFEDWEQTLSRFRPDSELSRLNQAVDQPARVSDDLWNVFQAARAAEKFTDGLVTPTVLDAMLEAGYDRDFASLQFGVQSLPTLHRSLALTGCFAKTSDPAAQNVPALAAVQWDAAEQTIQLPAG